MSGAAPKPNTTGLVLEDVTIRFVAVPEGDSSIPFLSVLGTVDTYMGICPLCKRHGRVKDFCFECCKVANMVMEMCPDCQDEGPVGLPCQWCGEARYGVESIEEEDDEPIPKGTYDMIEPTEEQATWGSCPRGSCPLCNQEGIRGCLCSGCGDKVILYE